VRENEQLTNLLLVVKRGATIRGKITGLRPDELSAVEVVVQAPGDSIGTTSMAPDGTYAIYGVPNGRVEVSAQTYSQRSISKSFEIPVGVLEASLDLEFLGLAKLSGRITRAGQPVASGLVTALPRSPGATAGSAKTAQNGLYVIDGLSEGEYDVSLDGEGTKSLRISGDTVLDIELPGLSVSGRVLEANSREPVSGVTLQVQRAGSRLDATPRTANTDALGRFSTQSIEPGQYQIVAHKRGYKVGVEILSVPTSSELTVFLTPAEGIVIRVRDGISGLPLRAVTIDAFSNLQPVRLNVALDETGSGELPQLTPGRYTLVMSSGGYAASSVAGWMVPGSPLDISLTPGGRLEIHADSIYTNAKASLINANEIAPHREFELSQLTVFPNLAPGEYSLLAKRLDQTDTYRLRIFEGQTTVLQVK